MDSKRLIIDFIKENKYKYLLGIIFILIVDTLQLVFPKILGYITDDLQNGSITTQMILGYIGLILAVSFGMVVFRFLFRIYIFGTEKKLEYQLRKKLFNHLLTLSNRFYNTHKTGDMMALATNDINAVRMAMGMGILLLVDTIFLTIAVLIVMFKTIDIRLTLLALTPMPIIALFGIWFGKIVHRRFTAVQEAFSALTDKVQESLSGIRVVKAFVQEKDELSQFNEASQISFEKNMHLARLWGVVFPFTQLIATLGFVIIIGYGGIQVMMGDISMGDFIAFNSYLAMLVWPMMSLGWIINIVQRGSASLNRINEILIEQPEITDSEAMDISSLKGHIRFEKVDFSYEGSQSPVLEQIDIDLPPGKTLAIIGGTGSGKTTLVNLLLRLYDIKGGALTIDGYPINKIPLSVLRTDIGYVPQETFLFSTSIKENIAFGKNKCSDREIENAAKIAQIYDNISELPTGFDTIVGERGVTLSGGQKQRVSIARALIMDPKILILDDSLSAVDTNTEEEILKGLKTVMTQRTSIIIAHRISSILHADEIILLEDGHIIERGNHKSLLEQKGHYFSLHQKQLLELEIERA